MTQQDVKIVGYETANTLTNRGAPMTKRAAWSRSGSWG